MVTCPWCGTNYLEFQSNCKNCGGPLLPPPDAGIDQDRQPDEIPAAVPPPAPRQISDKYAARLMFMDGLAVAAGIFLLIGGIFLLVGAGLTLGVITAFVGIPFAMLGILMSGLGGAGLIWRYQEAMKRVNVLRWGEPVPGKIIETTQNLMVRVNRRNPWIIRYQFRANGQDYEGSVTTLNTPGVHLQPGRSAYVLYMPDTPGMNVLYPHP